MSDLVDKIRELPTYLRLNSSERLVSREAVLGLVGADDNALRQSLREIMKLLDDGILVRDISRDGEPGWAIRQIPVVQTLAKAAKLIGPSAR